MIPYCNSIEVVFPEPIMCSPNKSNQLYCFLCKLNSGKLQYLLFNFVWTSACVCNVHKHYSGDYAELAKYISALLGLFFCESAIYNYLFLCKHGYPLPSKNKRSSLQMSIPNTIVKSVTNPNENMYNTFKVNVIKQVSFN